MLCSIHIKNIVLIEDLELDFANGFTSLTGETGAGKSIILSAMGLILGKKADSSIIRFGQEVGEVVAQFSPTSKIQKLLKANEIECEDELVIRRKITSDGKTKAFINDTSVTLKLLAELGENLVEIHGQHDQSTLLNGNHQREIVDKFGNVSLSELAGVYASWKAKLKELDERKAKIEAARKEEDYLNHVRDELSDLNPQVGEEEQLSDKRRAMMDFEKTSRILREAIEELTDGKNVDSAIVAAQKILIRSNNEIFKTCIDALERASLEVGNVFSEIERIESSFDADPEALERLEERLFKIREIARKHNTQPDQLAELLQETEQKLKMLKTEEGDIKSLEAEVLRLAKEYDKLAREVSEKRKETASKMQLKVVQELKPLAMQGTKFEVKFTEAEPSAVGIDRVEFYASTNPGTPLAPLANIASGGEISRFMLALKVVLLDASSAPTIIFDEIDTGTGGSVAAAIGERLARLGKRLQVFVVTHLPQVAAQAENHMKVEKAALKGKNVTSVRVLNAKERKEELARMLAGSEITDEARAAADRLLG